jgi:hypothetical protein
MLQLCALQVYGGVVMGRPSRADALKSISVRVLPDVAQKLDDIAAAEKMSRSDAFRRVIQIDQVRPTQLPTPGRHRGESRVAAKPLDPILARATASVSNSLNQIARGVNIANASGQLPNVVDILVSLVSIEDHMAALRRAHVGD